MVAVSPDGTLAMDMERNHQIRVWRLTPEMPWRIIPTGGRSGVAFNADGRHAALTGSLSESAPAPQAGRVFSLPDMAPAGPDLPCGGALPGALFLENGMLAQLCATQSGHDPAKMFLPDGASGSVQFWDWRAGRLVREPSPLPSEPWALTAQSNRGELSVHFWDAATAQRVAPDFLLPGHEMKELRLSPDGRLAFIMLIAPVRGFAVLDLAALHDTPALPDADLAQLARLNAGGYLREGAFMKFTGEEFLHAWRDFRTRHPEWQRVKQGCL